MNAYVKPTSSVRTERDTGLEVSREAEEEAQEDAAPVTYRAVPMFSSGAGSWMAARRYIEANGPQGVALLFADVKGDQNPSRHAGEDDDNYRFAVQAAAELFGVPLPDCSPTAAEIAQATAKVAAWTEPPSDNPAADIASNAQWMAYRRVAAAVLPQLVWLVPSEDIWAVYKRRRRIGSSYAANCSEELKQKVAKRWLKEHSHINTEIVIGIDWTEMHRIPAVERAYYPKMVRFPLCEPPYMDKDAMLAAARDHGLEPPRLYQLNLPHANCGGFCVRAGQGQFAMLLREYPERYAYHEEQEERTRQHLGKDVSILSDRSRKGILRRLGLTEADVERVEVSPAWYDADLEEWRSASYVWQVKATGAPLPSAVPRTLREFREQLEVGTAELDLFDIGGCGCFVDERPAPDDEAGAA